MYNENQETSHDSRFPSKDESLCLLHCIWHQSKNMGAPVGYR